MTSKKNSLRESLVLLSAEERLKLIQSLTPTEAKILYYDWHEWARDNQLAPETNWTNWLILAGRGYGKTRTGAEKVREWATSGKVNRIALLGQTPADVRDAMIEGESGILEISPPEEKPIYNSSRRRVEWSNGCFALIYSGAEPEAIRGKQHEKAWVDEICAFRYPQEAWDNLAFGMRLGTNPQTVITTTPKPIKVLKEIMEDPSTAITKGNTYENRDNLPESFFRQIISRYEGTRLGRQEINADILDDNPNALWQRSIIDKYRVVKYPALKSIVVGVDPEATSSEQSAETGIIAVGYGEDEHWYVLDDKTIKGLPNDWGSSAVALYHKLTANTIVVEINQGGDMCEFVIHTIDRYVPVTKVRASKGKYTRAEPVSALYEQGKVHHVGFFAELEDQLCEWEPGNNSPDRLDALVWAISHYLPNQDIYEIW